MLNKVFTFYSNRFDSATTSIALAEDEIKHLVLVHNPEQADGFIKSGRVRGDLIITNQPRGLAYQRNFALDSMEFGEWAAFLCDDYKRTTSLPLDWILSSTVRIPVDQFNQNVFRMKKESHSRTLGDVFSIFPRLIKIAEANGIHLIGFALHDNPLNLGRKFSTRGLADGRFWLVKKSHYRFDLNVQMIDDYGWTAENLIRHGKVLILNWLLPYFERYSPGGYGSASDRAEKRALEVQYLCKKYAPLIQPSEKPGVISGNHLRILANKKNILEARKRFFNLGIK